jgi:hypothetical protein
MTKLPFAGGKYFGWRKWEEMRGNFKHNNITHYIILAYKDIFLTKIL